jgi:hypothetical protein
MGDARAGQSAPAHRIVSGITVMTATLRAAEPAPDAHVSGGKGLFHATDIQLD